MLWVERQVVGAVILIAVVMMMEVFPLCMWVCMWCVNIYCKLILHSGSSWQEFKMQGL